MALRNYLAFDLGAESGRAVLGTLDGKKLTLEVKHRFANPNGRLGKHLYWNLLSQWEELKNGLRSVSGTKLDGIGVDTWGVDFGFIDSGGAILGLPFHYRDERNAGMMERAFAIVPREKIFETTGTQFMQINSLYQLMATDPGVLAAAKLMLFVPDLFNYLFTGVAKAEFSIASTSQMLDPRTGQWAIGMIEELGLPTRILPEIIPSGTVVGPLLGSVAVECEVEGTPPVIAPACHDTASAVVAVPASCESWCYISSGTWSLMGVELNAPMIDEKSKQYDFTNEGGFGGTIRFLKNIMGLWLVQECRRQWVREGHDHTYAELTEMASRARGHLALLDLDYAPLASPGEMVHKVERYCRETHQTVPQSRGEVVRVCLDGLALSYRRTLLALEDILGRRIETIHIVGGGSQNTLLNQMTADACNRPVIAGPIEATAIGNILVQGLATGDIGSLAGARGIVRESFEVVRYEPREAPMWDRAHARQIKIIAEREAAMKQPKVY
jgi:rhamnulokinase